MILDQSINLFAMQSTFYAKAEAPIRHNSHQYKQSLAARKVFISLHANGWWGPAGTGSL